MSLADNVVVLVCSVNEQRRVLTQQERDAIAHWFHTVSLDVRDVHMTNTVQYNALVDVRTAFFAQKIEWQDSRVMLLPPNDMFLAFILFILIVEVCRVSKSKLPDILRTGPHGPEICRLQHIVETQGGTYDPNISTK